MTAGPKAATFQPDHFFLARTEGRGIVRDLTGWLIDRPLTTKISIADPRTIV